MAVELGYVPVVSPKSNRRNPWDYDKELYKQRNQVERPFRRLKRFRRIFTRYDKLDIIFLSFVYFAFVVDALMGTSPRGVDELGRIVIPMETRKNLDIAERDPLAIMIDGDKIILRKHTETCSMCGQSKDLWVIENLKLCPVCIKMIAGLAT